MPRFRNLSLKTITPDPDQPRKMFDDGAQRQLESSMGKEGLLKPITVRPREDVGGVVWYVIIGGERRFRAAMSLEWETIPALVHEKIEEGKAAMLQLLENIVRSDLNPIEEAIALKKALDNGTSMADLSKSIGMVPGQIGWRVKMLDAPSEVLDLVRKGHCTPSLAHKIAKLPVELRMPAFRKVMANGMKYDDSRELCILLNDPLQADLLMAGEQPMSKAACRKKSQIEAAVEKLGAGLMAIHEACEGDPNVLIEALKPMAGLIDDQLIAGMKNMKRLEAAARKAKAATIAQTVLA